ncbi:MAG: mechanosensitive ion channel family protein [Deltaproteobacteria bacterium]|nr:mechanosensitive ion channel family protein [Deltaproteobacteria bacterium]
MNRPFSPLGLALVALLAAMPAVAAERPRSVPDKDELVNEGLEAPPAELDRSTPARSWAALVRSCRDARPQLGVHLLNLGDVPVADRKTLGPVLAQQLCSVLKTAGKAEAQGLDDSALGPLADDLPANYVVVQTLSLPTGSEDLWLRRIRDTASNQHLWLLTKQSVSQIPTWYRALVTRDLAVRRPLQELHGGLSARPEKLNPENPREALTRFAALCRAGDYAQAAFLLDLSGVEKARQPEEGPRLARRLGLVLKRLRPAGFGSVSNDPAGAPEREVAVDEEVAARAALEDREVSLKLARYPRTGGAPVWVVSADTAGLVDEVYDQLGYGAAGDLLPAAFFEWQALGVQLWQWLGLLIAFVLALALGYAASWLTRGLLGRAAARTSWAWDDELVAALKGPLAIGFAVVAFLALTEYLALGEGPRESILVGCKLTAILAGGWLLLRLVDVAGHALVGIFQGRHDDLATAMVPVFRKVLKPIAAVLVGVVALQNLGLNVAGLIAGLGIGGLAIALAGKSTLENLFGSLAIAFDRPFKIGEFVKVGDFMGVIEDVGLRSTRIRTLDRTLVSVPNGQMADAKVENFARRDRFKVGLVLGLEYATSMDQLKLIIDDLKKSLISDPRVFQEAISVRFIGYGAYALNLEMLFWVLAPSFDVFTGIREELLFEIGRIVERSGARLAFPSQTLYQAPAAPADPRLAEQARLEVEKRSEAGVLCVPEIPTTVREAALQKAGEKKSA